jgi:hypothetical protein
MSAGRWCMESEQLFPLRSEKISVSRLIGTPSLKKYQKRSNYIQGTWYNMEHQRTKVTEQIGKVGW